MFWNKRSVFHITHLYSFLYFKFKPFLLCYEFQPKTLPLSTTVVYAFTNQIKLELYDFMEISKQFEFENLDYDYHLSLIGILFRNCYSYYTVPVSNCFSMFFKRVHNDPRKLFFIFSFLMHF